MCETAQRREKRKKKQSESAAGISLSSISFDRKTRESMKQKQVFKINKIQNESLWLRAQ